ncbi:nitroimidazol reductase NimA-like FMN-containing flavoprotein (pyridoxamine 5'-phosphate oxidase superfamily) [Microbacterium foliorum]|uniref:Nitroimidazol reductase NimA-like FMN-containing flavoprotein (Pyridoxamine 5'-phosphate oxidase superfamily) n=1 Tax=Microbacterium foliorum TaxID=104336 RepID=A0ABU1HNA1_9MICO|nr:pyridoxamine 5'-phosphate oxidase family protein [Microbacterium foliorum]MDR6141516.1 nitroimidazol reductase NimA-like FMN-containing flavoprotein (pyridoxamine 5'-phosphate oxidase superfamily) [Microbacterium foliorum]
MANDDPNPYFRDAAPAPETDESAGVEEIGTAGCWRLVEAHSLGRLAIQTLDGHPDVFPLNYLVHEGNLYMRSAPGSKLRSLIAHPQVALEVDGMDDGFYWSVVMKGTATRLNTDAAIEASGILDLVSSSPTAKHNYVRLVPETITGRRFAVRDQNSETMEHHLATAQHGNAAGAHTMPRIRTPHRTADKPQPIPHLRPWGNG